MLIAAPEFKSSDYRRMVEQVRPSLTELEQVVFLSSADWDALVAGARSVSPERLAKRSARLRPGDPINIQYTSGTTGFPKGATLTHVNILNNAYFVGQRCGYGPDDRICIPVPFYHCFGMVMGNLAATSHGATMVIPNDAFEPRSVLEAVEAERCTSLYGVPTMFIAELDLPDFDRFDLGTLRTGIMAGAPCPVEIMKQTIERMHMREVTICYGMTETSPVSTQTEADDSLERRTSTVGRVHPHVEIKIVSPDSGEIVSPGLPGELCTRGYSVMRGYWNDPERTAEAIDADGFMHTGDLAVMDKDGYLNIVGRIKDMVIRGGENVYPREIEEFLHTHPDVNDVQVIGVPDPKFGEELMAWIQLREGADVDEEAIRAFCKDRIAHYKVPRYVRFTREFPMTVTGKVQKYKLREQAVQELDLAETVTA
jgi:fatty-acyl-CoA synthase